MNLNDKNIDQVFRDAAQNSETPRYDHSYWKEMDSILGEEDKRKRVFLFWSVAGSIVTALLVSSLFVLNNNESSLQIANNSNTPILKTSSNQKVEPAKNGNNKIKNGPILNESTDDKYVDISNERILNATKNTNNDIKKTQEFVVGQESNESIIKNASQEERDNISNSPISNRIQNGHLQNYSLTEKNKDVENDSGSNNSVSTEELAIVSLSPRLIEFKPNSPSKNLLPFNPQKRKSINFYAKLSGGLMENYETSRPFQSGVFDLSLNLEYQKEQVLFRTGFGVQATSNADIVVSERAKVYGFGLTTHQNNLSYQSIYDIYIPIEIGYSLNNTSFGFGLQTNYMVRTTMNYESLENNVVVDEAKMKGFEEGLNSFTSQGYVWLEQSISNRFSAGIKIGTNLNSRIKEGRYFNESATTNPLYGQLTLRYNFIK